MLTLWYAPNTIALASLITLEEVGAAYVPRRLDFAAAEQKGSGYAGINPKGRVPALDTGAGIVTETPAVLTFLAQSFPEMKLLPDTPLAAARVNEFMAYLCATVHVSHAHWRRGARWSDDPAVIEALTIKVPQNMSDHFAYLEGRFPGPWAMGADYSIADPYLFVLTGWLSRYGVEVARFPKIAAHHAMMLARPAVRRALAIQDSP